MPEVNCIYVAASSLDARYTRICVASVRYFYPHIPIRLLMGGALERGLADELRKYWNVDTAELAAAGDYGWGFVKLEALFGKPGEKFLVLDSDTILTGLILDKWSNNEALFLVDDENQTESDARAIYYDWQSVSKVDRTARAPEFLFNSGQWFGTAGVLTRADFAPWLKWEMPRKVSPPGLFMNGEQGILNYILNRKATLEGLRVERKEIMRWPGKSMSGLDVETVSQRTAPPLIIHWAGMKHIRLRDMVGGDLLRYFETFYYSRLPMGIVKRLLANCRHFLTHWRRSVEVRINLGYLTRIGAAISRRLLGRPNRSIRT